jgi:hypothetical protein
MSKKLVLLVCVLVAVLAFGGCTTTKVSTQVVTLPGSTSILPGSTVTLPAVTVTGVTTLPAVTTTIPPYTVTVAAITIGPNPFLPDSAPPIRSHALIVDVLEGYCLLCHGSGGPNEFPMPPTYDGAASGSSLNPGVYVVVQDSIQDHTDRQANTCLSCHPVPGK